jgi:hypothetical protein
MKEYQIINNKMIFNDNFDKSLDNYNKIMKDNSIKDLKLGYFFNQPIDNLPNSITHLTLAEKFNQPINYLPNSITHLYFTSNSIFNQLIDKLPNSITHLELGGYFNQPIV